MAAPADAEGRVEYGTPAGRLVLAATVLASSLAFLDMILVPIMLPGIGRELGAGTADLQWVVNGYTLALSALLLLAGSLGDRYGRRRVFLIGNAWFVLASLACAIAPNVETLVAARVLQGIGGALLTPTSLALIQASFVPEHRSRAIGLWAGLSGVAGLAGPFVGGWLIQTVGWRWAFAVNLPIGVAAVLLTRRGVPESGDPEAARHLDAVGAALCALGLGALTWALTAWTERGPGGVAFGLALGVAGLVAFALVEARTASPMLPLGLFRVPAWSATQAETFLLYAALAGYSVFVPVTLQVVAGWDPLPAGLATAPSALLLLLFAARSGALAARIGPRFPMAVGPTIAAVGVALLAGIGPDAGWGTVLPGAVLVGLGLVGFVAPLTSTALATAPLRYAGLASGVNTAVARAAALIAVATLPLVSGLGGDLTDPVALAGAHRVAMLVCAGLFVGGGLIALAYIPGRPRPQAS